LGSFKSRKGKGEIRGGAFLDREEEKGIEIKYPEKRGESGQGKGGSGKKK